MKKILLSRDIPEECRQPFEDRFVLEVLDENADIRMHIGKANAYVCVGVKSPFTAEMLLSAGVDFEAVGTCTVGYDHIDVDACNRAGVALINTPEEVLNPTSELTVGLILDVARGISRQDKMLRETLVVEHPFFPMESMTLYGRTAGIVGFGRIGKRVAQLLHAFGMNILYTDPTRVSSEQEAATGARFVTLDTLLKNSDVVTLHCPYFPENHHMMDAQAFSKMKPSAWFINAARGKVMDEKALIQALKSGEIAGAALDVYEDEPVVSEELAALDNVVIVPHIGTLTYDARLRMCTECLNGVAAILDGQIPDNLVNRRELGL